MHSVSTVHFFKVFRIKYSAAEKFRQFVKSWHESNRLNFLESFTNSSSPSSPASPPPTPTKKTKKKKNLSNYVLLKYPLLVGAINSHKPCVNFPNKKDVGFVVNRYKVNFFPQRDWMNANKRNTSWIKGKKIMIFYLVRLKNVWVFLIGWWRVITSALAYTLLLLTLWMRMR